MKHYFVADAHLLHPDDTNYQLFLAFLKAREKEDCALYLLGDIFHFWVSYRHSVFSPYVPVLEQLWKLRNRGIPICFVKGNHDYHLEGYFGDRMGCRIITENASLDVDGHRIFISHGDLMDQDDRSYRLLRRFLRHPWLTWLMCRAHPDLVWNISLWANRQSQRKRRFRQAAWVPEAMLTRHASCHFAQGHDTVITGHIHVPWFKETPEGTIISLGNWTDEGSYAVCEDGRFSLASFRP